MVRLVYLTADLDLTLENVKAEYHCVCHMKSQLHYNQLFLKREIKVPGQMKGSFDESN